jgi:hypothetical protein
MPFQGPNWRNYHSGDLFYGLHKPRLELAKFLGADQICTIDQYDIASADRTHASLQHDPDFVTALKNHSKYNDVVNAGDWGWDLANRAHWNAKPLAMTAIAKRKCKGGLDWITHSTFRHIHFCLEGLDLVAAAEKNYDGSSGGMADSPGRAGLGADPYTKARSITGAELRWVYRNRSDPRVREQIQFWSLDPKWIQCPPPWEDPATSKKIRDAWANYKPTKEYKSPTV